VPGRGVTGRDVAAPPAAAAAAAAAPFVGFRGDERRAPCGAAGDCDRFLRGIARAKPPRAVPMRCVAARAPKRPPAHRAEARRL